MDRRHNPSPAPEETGTIVSTSEDTHPTRSRTTAILELRRQSLYNGCFTSNSKKGDNKIILNESPCLFDTIEYSSQHDTNAALEMIRQFLQQHGNAHAGHRFGGIGIHLYGRCLDWHVRGQCNDNECSLRRDHHRILNKEEARRIERALDPAIRSQGPIFLKAITSRQYDDMLRIEEKKRKAAAAAKVQQLQRERERREALLAERERKRGRHTIQYRLPGCLDDTFYRSVFLAENNNQWVDKIETEFSCLLELVETDDDKHDNSPLSQSKLLVLAISGSNLDAMIQSQFSVERLLYRQCLPEVRAFLLLELEKLNKLRSTVTDTSGFFQCCAPVNDSCCSSSTSTSRTSSRDWWYAKLDVGTVTNQEDGVISLADAKRHATVLRCRYGEHCHIHIYSQQQQLVDDDLHFYARKVPSHVIICGERRVNVGHCRDDFFMGNNGGADDDDDDDDVW